MFVADAAPMTTPQPMAPPQPVGKSAPFQEVQRDPARRDTATASQDAYRRGDYAEAAKLAKRGATRGDFAAMTLLGKLYVNGQGLVADEAEGIRWLTQAAARHHVEAAYELGMVYGDASRGHPDYAQALYWFVRAAHLGHADAATNLALLYRQGLGTARSLGMALQWINAAIALNPDYQAQHLGQLRANRLAILKEMSNDEIDAAARIVSPDAPLSRAILRDPKAFAHAIECPKGTARDRTIAVVVLAVKVGEDGRVTDARVEGSSGFPVLDRAALAAAVRTEIEPLRISDQPVDSWQLLLSAATLH